MTKLFTAEADFRLVTLTKEPQATDIVLKKFHDDSVLVEGEELTIHPLSIDGLIACNNYIRKTYLSIQKEAVRDWSEKDRNDFMRLAMSHIVNLSLGTREGYSIIFDSVEGLCFYMWQHVKDRFPTYQDFLQVAMPNDVRVFEEISRRFFDATMDLKHLCQQESMADELPEEEQYDQNIDLLISHLLACGSFSTVEEAKKLTIEQAQEVVKKANELHGNEIKEEKKRPSEAKHDPVAKANIKALLG
jgi:Ni,Fe-hydrogenase I large subunit